MIKLTQREKARQRQLEELERKDRESEIAQCECGAQVRKDSKGEWIHGGKCELSSI